MGQDVSLFTEVDKTGDPDFFIRFLDQGNALPDIQRSKGIILNGLRLRDGLSVLDIGCGAGMTSSISPDMLVPWVLLLASMSARL